MFNQFLNARKKHEKTGSEKTGSGLAIKHFEHDIIGLPRQPGSQTGLQGKQQKHNNLDADIGHNPR